MKQVKYLLGEEKSTVSVDRYTGRLRERVTPSWQFESLLWDIFSRFPLAHHFDLPGSKSVFGISQDLPMCACASLSQDVFCWRGLWVDLAALSLTPLLTSKEPFCACVVREVSWLWEWEICGLLSSIWAGPTLLSQLSCYSHLISEYWSRGNQPFAPGAHVFPASPMWYKRTVKSLLI